MSCPPKISIYNAEQEPALDALRLRNDASGLRSGGFHYAIIRPRTNTEGQSHAIPWRRRTEPSLARASHSSKVPQTPESVDKGACPRYY